MGLSWHGSRACAWASWFLVTMAGETPNGTSNDVTMCIRCAMCQIWCHRCARESPLDAIELIER
eukprot:scaffold5523_cov112-Isochrysis_galbana.AAC.1